MFSASEIIPLEELAIRHELCRKQLKALHPDALGLLVTGRISIYYLSGTLANGLVWIPQEGPVQLFVRRNIERAELESSLLEVMPFRSYSEVVPHILGKTDVTGVQVACDKSALPWSLAELLTSRFAGVEFLDGDAVISRARAFKTPWEFGKLRHGGSIHKKALCGIVPKVIRPGSSERSLAVQTWQVFFSLGHAGVLRMSASGEESFLGGVSAGDSGNYPTSGNGPSGGAGVHPVVPFMGSDEIIWKENMVLSLDVGFNYEGYHTDKTQNYFSGPASAIPDVFKRAQDTCDAIEAAVSKAMLPGAVPSDLYKLAMRMADQAGFAEHFMGFGSNKVPFVGHGIGLTYDEWPVIADRFEEPLQAGMVIALEPKIGVAGIGLAGTENTYEITEDGSKSLTGEPGGIICLS